MIEISKEKKIALTALCDGLDLPRSTLYRQTKGSSISDKRILPHNAISREEKEKILSLLHSDRFIDATPYNAFYSLLDEGEYIASIRTMYRVLQEVSESKDRRHQRHHKNAIKPELIATSPNQVWSWDITKLKSVNRFEYFYLYVILDIFSRYVVGWMIADRERQELAKTLIEETALRHGIRSGQLTIHSDNGPSMTSHTVSQLLETMGILKTHNRPYTSNDNPFSESQFKTLKYCPQFPERFESLKGAECFCQPFFKWYNNEHYHSGILFLKPSIVHFGLADAVLKKRHDVLLKAYDKNPERFNRKRPKLKTLKPVYINPPTDIRKDEK